MHYVTIRHMYKYVLSFTPTTGFITKQTHCTLRCSLYFLSSHSAQVVPDIDVVRELLRQKLLSAQHITSDTALCDEVMRFCIQSFECVHITIAIENDAGDHVEKTVSLTPIYFSLGSNIGDRTNALRTAVRMLQETETIVVDAASSIVETEPVGFAEQPAFYNAVLKARTVLTPEQLLIAIKKIEQTMGRTWAKRNYPRQIDIDILYYGSLCIHSARLTIPHPQVYDRPFVAALLAEINPSFIDPVTLLPLEAGTSTLTRVEERCV